MSDPLPDLVRERIRQLRDPIGAPKLGLTEHGRGKLSAYLEVARWLGLDDLSDNADSEGASNG